MSPPDPPHGATGPTDPTADAANGKASQDIPAGPPSGRGAEPRTRRRTGMRAPGDLSPKTFAKLTEHLAALDRKAAPADAGPNAAGGTTDARARPSQAAPSPAGWFEPAETPAGGGRFARRASLPEDAAVPASPPPIDWGPPAGEGGGRAGGPGRSG